MWDEFVTDGDYIPISEWGKDHWSTFAYFETRAVDGKGIINNNKMRCDPRLHRAFANIYNGGVIDGSKYPTYLKDRDLENHDDWSCLEDMVAVGLIRSWQQRKYSERMVGFAEAKVELTPAGYKVIALLRRHKSSGGGFGNFHLESVPPNQKIGEAI